PHTPGRSPSAATRVPGRVRLTPPRMDGSVLAHMRGTLAAAAIGVAAFAPQPERPMLTSELVFPLEHWHNHASMIVEAPNGDLIVDWFHGSGERTADDVLIRGARLKKGSKSSSEPVLMADTPGSPDSS